MNAYNKSHPGGALRKGGGVEIKKSRKKLILTDFSRQIWKVFGFPEKSFFRDGEKNDFFLFFAETWQTLQSEVKWKKKHRKGEKWK